MNEPLVNYCGVPAPIANTSTVTFFRWICPYCHGTGTWAEGERCMNCHGYGLTDEVEGFDEADLTLAPTPPAVMRAPCVDCAYRPGSPEDGSPQRPGPDKPFYCHHGMHRVGDSYVGPALVNNELPLGAMVCAGWWALATGNPLPEKAFRDPGGSDRSQDAPRADA